MESKAVVSLTNGKKAFGNNEVLKDISLTVNAGDVLAIIGPSGGGKSTLLRCMTLLETLDSGDLSYGDLTVCANDAAGRAVYGGKDVIAAAKTRFGLVFQNFNLFPQYTARQNVMLASELLAKEQPDPFRSTTDQRCIMSCAEVYFRLVNQPERDPEKEKTLLELAKTHRRAAWKIPLEHKSQKLQALMVSYCPHLGAKVWKLVRWVKGLKN